MNTNFHNNDSGQSGRGRAFLPLCVLAFLLLITACSSIDCPMDNLVYTQYQLMKADGRADTLSDTLTISTPRMDGRDTVLINRDVDVKAFSLPISYAHPVDTFFFEMRDTATNSVFIDTLTVSKDNKMHFESVDCSASYFHTLTAASCTKHRIDSVKIINSEVNYDTSRKHFYIYFRSDR